MAVLATARLTPDQLSGLTPYQLSGLTPDQLRGLTPDQLRGSRIAWPSGDLRRN